MHILEAVILLMTLVVFSNVVNHFIPAVPVSLIQVVLGLGAALVMRVTIPLETDWFCCYSLPHCFLMMDDGFQSGNCGSFGAPFWPMQLYWFF